MNLELSLKERLLLANQYQILSRIAGNDLEAGMYNELAIIFTNGYVRDYEDSIELFSDELSNEECKFVIDVLELYRDLYWSWEKSIEIQNNIRKQDVLFKGFDLNDSVQVKYYSYYQFMVGIQGKWNEIKQLIEEKEIAGYNSHGFGPSMSKLSKMISRRLDLKKQKDSWGSPLILEDIEYILS